MITAFAISLSGGPGAFALGLAAESLADRLLYDAWSPPSLRFSAIYDTPEYLASIEDAARIDTERAWEDEAKRQDAIVYVPARLTAEGFPDLETSFPEGCYDTDACVDYVRERFHDDPARVAALEANEEAYVLVSVWIDGVEVEIVEVEDWREAADKSDPDAVRETWFTAVTTGEA